MPYKITHDRANCIGCRACEVVCPDFWKMNAGDNKSDLLGAKTRPDGWTERTIEDKDLEANMNAAQSCPVNVIHVEKPAGEKVI